MASNCPKPSRRTRKSSAPGKRPHNDEGGGIARPPVGPGPWCGLCEGSVRPQNARRAPRLGTPKGFRWAEGEFVANTSGSRSAASDRPTGGNLGIQLAVARLFLPPHKEEGQRPRSLAPRRGRRSHKAGRFDKPALHATLGRSPQTTCGCPSTALPSPVF